MANAGLGMGNGWRRLITICAAASAAVVTPLRAQLTPVSDTTSRDSIPAMLIGHVVDSAGRRTPRRRDHAQQIRQGARDHRRQRRVPHRRSAVGHDRVQRASHRLRVGELHRRPASRQDAARHVLAHADRAGAAHSWRCRIPRARRTGSTTSTRRKATDARHVHHARGHRAQGRANRARTSFGRCRAFVSSRGAAELATRW